MAKQTVNIGNNANDGSGDPARSAFTKINQNTTEIYQQLGASDGATFPNNLPVWKGGTAANNADDARTNLAALGFERTAADSLQDFNKNGFYFLGNTPSDQPQKGALWWHLINLYNIGGSDRAFQITSSDVPSNPVFFRKKQGTAWGGWVVLYGSSNTTVDGNGYLKPSSPVVRLYADKVELINEAIGQPITFEKLAVGNYLVKNTTGLRDDGWYIETPRDNNGNVLVFVEYTQLDNKDISVKTYKKKFDIDTASIVADHDNPMDIPTDRWIDLRFNDYPVPEQQTINT